MCQNSIAYGIATSFQMVFCVKMAYNVTSSITQNIFQETGFLCEDGVAGVHATLPGPSFQMGFCVKMAQHMTTLSYMELLSRNRFLRQDGLAYGHATLCGTSFKKLVLCVKMAQHMFILDYLELPSRWFSVSRWYIM